MSHAYDTLKLREKLDQRRTSLRFWEQEADLGIPGFSVAEHRARLAREITELENALEDPQQAPGGSS